MVRIRPHKRIDPARADHKPVREYSSGVTLLLFSATKTMVKSCVTRACSMATVASNAPTSITGANSRPSSTPGRATDPPPGGTARPGWGGRGATLAHQSDRDDHGAGHAGDEGQPHPDGPERRASAQDLVPLSDFTRSGLAAQ